MHTFFLMNLFNLMIYYIQELCDISIKKCKSCQSYHYISYAVEEVNGTRVFFDHLTDFQYFHFSRESIFETKFLQQCLGDIMYKHASFSALANAYNYNYILSKQFFAQTRTHLDRRRLSDVFFAYHAYLFYKEYHQYNKQYPTNKPLSS